jgi:hypothetical protein
MILVDPASGALPAPAPCLALKPPPGALPRPRTAPRWRARSRHPGAQAASWLARSRARDRHLAADQDAHQPPSQVARPIAARRRARVSKQLLLDFDGKGIDLEGMSPPGSWWD